MTELGVLQLMCWVALFIWFIAGPLVAIPMVRAAELIRNEHRARYWIIGNLVIALFNVVEAATIAWLFQFPPGDPGLRRYALFIIPIGLLSRAVGFFLIGFAAIGPARFMPWRRAE